MSERPETAPPSPLASPLSSSAISDSPSSPLDTEQKPREDKQNNRLSTSFLNHITYPISYTTSALLRRLSEDSAPTPLARALSANYNGMLRENAPAVFNPPTRTHSPFQPPPLTPLTLEGYRENTSHRGRLMSKSLAEEIRLLVPPRLQLVDTWRLGYSLEQNGSSLKSLFAAVEEWRGKRGGFVLVVKDGSGSVSFPIKHD